MLYEFHACHLGMSKTKGLARATLWWPKLDQAIEDKVKFLLHVSSEPERSCQSPATSVGVAGTSMVENIIIDHAGPYHNQLWLIIVDAHSMVGHIPSVINQFVNNH